MNVIYKFGSVPHRLGLYPVVNSLPWIVRMLDAGVTTLQLRIKDKPEDLVAADIEAAVLLGKRYGVRLFINDYWHLAILYGAYGVHLGQEDIHQADLHAICRAGLRLGISTHDDQEVVRALMCNPSYITIGHIFPTTTKQMPSAPQGLDNLNRLVTRLADITTVAISGITLDNIDKVLASGVGSIAVASAITSSPDWRYATTMLLAKITAWERNHVQ